MKNIKYLFLLNFITLTSLIFSQNKFVFNKKGLNPQYIIVEKEGKTQKELFNLTINWIKETYKNPEKVIKTTIDNKKIRIEGAVDDVICFYSFGIPACYNSFYTIEISFKDGKYKFEPIILEYYIPSSQYYSGRNKAINLKDGSSFYSKNGNIRKASKNIPVSIENLFNKLNQNLRLYINNGNVKMEDDDNW